VGVSRSPSQTQEQPSESNAKEQTWSLWPLLPIYPYSKRRTLRKEVVKDTIWTFEQVQGIFYVIVPIRMTVVRLDSGGLLVYAPVAPTRECVRLVRELEAKYGEVKYIILPTVSGLEHKVFVGPFARRFRNAQVFVAPSQWSFPVNLPLSWLGLPGKRTQFLPKNSADVPFLDEFDYEILGPIRLGLGPFEEVAFFHRRSRTLLVADSVISIPENPPELLQQDSYPLLFHARDSGLDPFEDNAANRRKGWQRICLFSLYFQPNSLETVPWSQAFQEAKNSPDRSKKNYFGLFPFRWKYNWQDSFRIARGGGRLLVAPILQALILNRAPQETIAWANEVSKWYFQRVIPCHFDAPVNAGPQQFRQAFAFLEKEEPNAAGFRGNPNQPLPEEDFELLWRLDKDLSKRGITPPAKEKV
jgi:hypothetical protein